MIFFFFFFFFFFFSLSTGKEQTGGDYDSTEEASSHGEGACRSEKEIVATSSLADVNSIL